MSVFRKIFGSSSKSGKKSSEEKDDNKFLPTSKTPVDERFTLNFNQNGGKFLYAENIDEIQAFFHQILEENNWQNKTALILNASLKDKFENFDIKITDKSDHADFLFTTCEYLIANDGSLLISSNQIAEKKLKELPKNFIIFAKTSQFVENISDGLRGIKARNKSKIPSNITTIKHFKISEDNDFLSYGSSSKNLYLLLLEDL